MAWLEKAPAHPEDYLATRFADAAQRDLSWSDVAELWPDPEALPDDFVHFSGHRGPGLRDRLRSATDCYFDLGDSLVEVEGGSAPAPDLRQSVGLSLALVRRG